MDTTNTAQADYLAPLQGQPGLWAHSYSDKDTLMHQFQVSYTPEGGTGNLVIASFRTSVEALEYIDAEQDAYPKRQYAIKNQFAS